MIILSTSFHIQSSRQQEFVEWADAAMAALEPHGKFMRILTVIDPDVSSYSMQWEFDTVEQAEMWAETIGGPQIQLLTAKMGDDALCFTTYMEVLG